MAVDLHTKARQGRACKILTTLKDLAGAAHSSAITSMYVIPASQSSKQNKSKRQAAPLRILLKVKSDRCAPSYHDDFDNTILYQ